MDYFAHIDGERKQSVLEHSEGVARLAGMFAGEFGKYEWGYCSGMLHDIGKYSLNNACYNIASDHVVCCMILESTVSGSREDFKKEMFRWTIRRLEHNFVRRKEDTTRF